MHTIETDFLVIGSGIAGLTFALEAAGAGSIAIVTRREDTTSASTVAQGGVAAVVSPDDLFDLHTADTIIAGDGLCDKAVVRTIVEETPAMTQRLLALGVRLDRNTDGSLHLHREGGHSRHRIVHTGDFTGREITSALVRAVRSLPNIRLFRNHTALDLIPESGGDNARCLGAWVLDNDNHRLVRFTARATVLCTGGAGQVFSRTTNPTVATGDGIAMAYRSGAALSNMEFMQFHPTGLRAPIPLLLTEALRGAGAELCRADGSSFMEKYHALGSLAPRDITARAVYMEGLLSGGIFLDARRVPDLYDRFPTVVVHCHTYGIDPATQPVPVTPAAHYLCGGITTDTSGRTTLPGLYACGETACTGLHGANRLAGNSLAEALITARHAAIAAVGKSAPAGTPADPPPYPAPASSAIASPQVAAVRDEIRNVMWEYVGIVRSEAGLRAAVHKTMGLLRTAETIFFSSPLTEATAELRNLALTAHLIALAAWNRPESRGTHFVAQPVRCRNAAADATGDSDGTGDAGNPCTEI